MTLLAEIGDFIELRGRHWLVDGIDNSGDPIEHRLVCVDDDAEGESITCCLEVEPTLDILRRDAWVRLSDEGFDDPKVLGAHLLATRWRTASAADRRLFQAPFRAGIRLEPYQLLPLKKALDLPRVNLLIADDVGLGKTVEAGLVARELLLRRAIDMIAVAAPASMTLQWQDEMEQKFGLDFTIVDRDYLLHSRRMRGYAANPWALGSRFIISHSVLSNELYVTGLRDRLGAFRPNSMFILDEAHHAAPSSGTVYAVESGLTRAVRNLAERFEHRLFLSATPHNGHSNSFATLLEILDPQRFTRGISVAPKDLEPVMVRRLKEDLRQLGEAFPERRIEPIKIDGLDINAPELRLADMLSVYGESVETTSKARFLFAILQQRLFSSVCAFHRTLKKHRQTLLKQQAETTVEDSGVDPDAALLVDESGDDLGIEDDRVEHATEDASASFKGVRTAVSRVDEMLALAEEVADRPDARVEKLLDWIMREMVGNARWRDRRLIIFTQWEDTRRWLEQCLREGLLQRTSRAIELDGRIVRFTGSTSLQERDRIKLAFNAPFDKDPVRILLCTDAAREGINLQTRCHDLFHLDLPWNPSRLEQRNGRIDRKLQPEPLVCCRYFIYAQRPEDTVLDALVRKTETIRSELGSAGEVLRNAIQSKLESGGVRRGEAAELEAGIRNAESDMVAIATEELGEDRETRMNRLSAERDALAERLTRAERRVGVDPKDLRHVVDVALGERNTALTPGEFLAGEALRLDPADPAFDTSWASVFDDLRPGRPASDRTLARWRRETPVRGLVFAPPKLKPGEAEPQDIVQLHLEHRLVKRLLSGFLAQGFRNTLKRSSVVLADVPDPRVVLLGRLALFGPGGRRLHEEIIPVSARWHERGDGDSSLSPLGERGSETSLEALAEALREAGTANEAIGNRIDGMRAADIADLRQPLESAAANAENRAVERLRNNGAAEAKALEELLGQQIRRVRRSSERTDKQISEEEKKAAAPMFDFVEPGRLVDPAERRQREADRRYWGSKLARLENQIQTAPAGIRESYRVVARRLEPVALVYLWPRRNA